MTLFRIAAYSSPLLLGMTLPFILTLARQKEWPRRVAHAAAPLVATGTILVLFLLWIFSGTPFGLFLKISCFLLAFGAFLFGLFHLAIALRLPPAVAQIVVGCSTALLCGTVFYFDPILEKAIQNNASREALQRRIDIAIQWNPYVVMASSIFEDDVLTRKLLYSRTLLSDLQRSYPRWPEVALAYVLLGFFGHVLYLGSVALRLRLSKNDHA